MLICNSKLRAIISVLAFLIIFFGVNTFIWFVADEPVLYIIVGFIGYIVTSVFMGLYLSLALGYLYEDKRKLLKIVFASFFSLGLYPLTMYVSWRSDGKTIIIASLFLTMGFVSSYWHYKLYGEDCYLASLEKNVA